MPVRAPPLACPVRLCTDRACGQRYTVLVDPYQFPRVPDASIPRDLCSVIEAEWQAKEAERRETEKITVTVLRNRSSLEVPAPL
jgi:hypothetical protein